MADTPADTLLGQTGDKANLPPDYYTCKASHAFDQWFACLTVGSQLRSYYRYGQKTSCGKHWSKFKMCMGMKLRSEESGKAIMEEFRDKEEAKRNSLPNVMDVWSRRE
ncbi:hypothetical protein H4S08_000009 [Coemansia sp. RSA 1365]|nr:hypothetical protein H4S08_000009 [Coemansia sp. RSA 1365]